MNIFNLNRHTVAALRFSALALFLAPALVHATITITGAPSVVTYDVENYAVAGTNTANITGDMWVSNASLGGAAITVSRSGVAFETPAVTLALGHNYITVYGRDGGGVIYSNTVNIWRYTIDGGANMAGSAYGRRLPGSLEGWGNNGSGQTNCPAGNDFIAIAAGVYHSLALRRDGSLVGWGNNSYGQTNCPAGNDFAAIAAGESYSLALRCDGSLVAWGWNNYGQINCPVGNDFIAIAAGRNHALALRRDGSLVGWGNNSHGQTTCPAGNDYAAIAAGESYSLALRRDGSLVAWGWNDYGQTNCPAGNDYIAIAAGRYHSLALRRDGSLVGWGNNDYGQTTCPAGNDFAAIASGYEHSLALRRDGSLVGWGWNEYGQTTCPAGNDFAAIAAGSEHSLALRFHPFVDITNENTCVGYQTESVTLAGTNSPLTDITNNIVSAMWWSNHYSGSYGTFVAQQSWTITNVPLQCGLNHITVSGTNVYGHIGSDSITIRRLSCLFITTDVWQVRNEISAYPVAGTNTANITGDMWVSNASLGGAAITFSRSGLAFETPAVNLALGYNYITVYGSDGGGVIYSNTVNIWRYTIDGGANTAGSEYGRRLPGSLVGWGRNDFGQTNCPAGNDFAAIAVGYYHSLALRRDGSIVGWGWNDYGQTTCPTGNDFAAIAAGYQHSLALRRDGSLVGWGDNWYGQTNCPAGNDYAAIAAGVYHSLALRRDGSLVGWGTNDYGQTACPAENDFIAIAAGYQHSLALRRDGSLVGWGSDSEGQITCPAGNDFVAIAAGVYHSLALRRDGSLVGWGNNDYGQTTCPAGNDFAAIASGYEHSLALRRDGSLVGWGWNDYGQTTCPAGNDFAAIAAGSEHSLALRFHPFVDITNENTCVGYQTESVTLAGTNSPLTDITNNIVSAMWWTNTANGSAGSFPALQSWQVNNIPLSVGTNGIAVTGTNVYGLISTDLIAIYRKTWAESSPQIATNALVFPACESVLLAGPLTSVVWRSEAIWDYVDNTTVMIAQISVYPSSTMDSAYVVTNNVSNMCGHVEWDVPDALVREQEVYVMSFDVVNSRMLTNSMVFTDNPFTIIPEPYTGVLLLLAVLRGANARKNRMSN